MNNNNGTNNPVPRVVKGTGFYTPMDLVPEATPQVSGTPPQSPTVVGEMVGMPTVMDVAPTETTTQSPSSPPQSGDGNNGQDD